MENIKGESFQELIVNSDCVIQFSATWCGPCKGLTRTIEANEKDLSTPFYKVDIDDNRELAQRFNVRNVPTLILFKNGKEANRMIGSAGVSQLKKFLDI